MVSNLGHKLTCWIGVLNPCVSHGLCSVPNDVWFGVSTPLNTEICRHNDLIYVRHLTIAFVSTTSHCSKRDVTIISGSQATLHTRIPITTVAMCDESLRLRFWQTSCTWYVCHFIQREFLSSYIIHLENRDLRIWNELFQNKVRLFIKSCGWDENQSPTFEWILRLPLSWLKVERHLTMLHCY